MKTNGPRRSIGTVQYRGQTVYYRACFTPDSPLMEEDELHETANMLGRVRDQIQAGAVRGDCTDSSGFRVGGWRTIPKSQAWVAPSPRRVYNENRHRW